MTKLHTKGPWTLSPRPRGAGMTNRAGKRHSGHGPASRERLFVLTWTDRHGERRGPMRHYLHLDTAAARATQLLITSGEPGDVAELAHLGTGMQLGHIGVRANGVLAAVWNWERPSAGKAPHNHERNNHNVS